MNEVAVTALLSHFDAAALSLFLFIFSGVSLPTLQAAVRIKALQRVTIVSVGTTVGIALRGSGESGPQIMRCSAARYTCHRVEVRAEHGRGLNRHT